MKEDTNKTNRCEEKCEAVAEKCLNDIYDLGSCRIKYNRCRVACGE